MSTMVPCFRPTPYDGVQCETHVSDGSLDDREERTVGCQRWRNSEAATNPQDLAFRESQLVCMY
jgi:hypothetical protein